MFRVSEERFVYRNELKVVGFCDAEVFLYNGQTVVVFTEIQANPGPSVTNAIECIIAQFCKAKDLDPDDILVIERYASHPDDLDLVTLAREYNTPSWRRLTDEEASPILAALNG